MGGLTKFKRRHAQAIASLLTEPTLRQAAEQCGVGERTLRRWLRNESFARRYRQARTQQLEATMNMLRQAGGQAVSALVTITTDTMEPAGARVSAARAIIELGIRSAEMKEFEERLSELEEQVARGKQ
jgi:hypothetical protein